MARRMACFVYEGVLLFGIIVFAGLVYAGLFQQRHALVGLHGLQATIFVVVGIYFIWCWSHGGQTLAMKTWQVRLVATDGGPVSAARATARYLFSWLWFLPALAGLYFSGLRGGGPAFFVVLAGVLAYLALARLHPSRQFLHDLVCGTQLVSGKAVALQHNPVR